MLPSAVQIGPHRVPFVYKPEIDLEGNEDDIVSGCFFPEDYRIEIRQGLRGSRMAEVLLHEVLHVVFANTKFAPESDEERAVTVLASSLTQIARDNPEFINCWLAHARS